MKSKYVLVLTIITLFLFTLLNTSCTKDENITENQDIIKKVIELEKNEYLLKTVQISYNEFLKNVEPLIFSNSNYLDRFKKEELGVKVKNVFDPRMIKKSDILNASDEELQKIRDEIVPPNIKVPIEKTMKFDPLNISKVYYDESMKGKTVFVTQLEDVYGKDFDAMFYRRYIFRKDNNEWKVFDMHVTGIGGYGSPKGSFVAGGLDESNLFKEFNGEKVVYDTVINVDQYDKK